MNDVLVGRKEETRILSEFMDNSLNGKGVAAIIKGGAGIGKSRLIAEFKEIAEGKGLKILTGIADAYTSRPFHLFREILDNIDEEPMLRDSEFTNFAKVFAVNKGSLLIADASPQDEKGLDSDIFAGMLSAVQDFIRDSFGGTGKQSSGLGRLEYGDLKIIIEHGESVFLAVVFRGKEHPNMKNSIRLAVNDIDEACGDTLADWNGNMEHVKPAQDILEKLVDIRFLVRKDLEGVKLDAERIRVADSVLDHLISVSDEQTLAILLEDMHWADESSLFVLQYLMRSISNRRIIILSTLRTGEVESVEEFADLMIDEGSCKDIALERLASKDILNMVENILPKHGLGMNFIDELESRCEGNPFFIQEILRHMLLDGAIVQEDGGYSLIGDMYMIPDNIEELVHRKLEAIEPDALSIVEFSSCIGREFDINIPGSSRMVSDIGSAISKLEDSGLIQIINEKAIFTHALFQEVIYKGITDRWRSVYHQNIGEIYESLYNHDMVIFELARHFSRSRKHSKAFDYCSRAGERSEAMLAPEQAIDYYLDAIKALDNMRKITGTNESRGELLQRLGDAYSLISDFDKAIEKYDMAFELDTDIDTMAMLHRKRAGIFEKRGDYIESGLECQKGLDLLDGKINAVTVNLMLVRSANLLRTGSVEEAGELANKALGLAKELGDKKLEANTYHLLGSMGLITGQFATAIENLDKAIGIREEIGDESGASASLNNLGIAHYYTGDVNMALDCYSKSLAIYQKIGDKYGMASLLNNMGGFSQDFGELDKALDYHMQSMDIKKQIGDKYGMASTYTNLGIVHRGLGKLDEALEFNQKGLKLATEIANAKEITININNIGEAYFEKGEYSKAEEQYKKAILICQECKDKHQESHSLRGMAKINIMMKDSGKAVEFADEALAISIEIGSQGEEWRSRNILGAALRSSGSFDKSKEELDKALEILTATGSSEKEPAVMFELGLLHRDMGNTDEAKKSFSVAREIYDKRGYIRDVSKIDKELVNLNQ